MSYYVYIVRCNDNSLYTGITTDIIRRVYEHNKTKKGAKYTKSRRPVSLVYSKLVENRSIAQKEEYKIKKLNKRKKEELVKNWLLPNN